MANILTIKVEDVNDLMDTFESIQVYRSASIDGVYTLQTTITLVEDDFYYPWTDNTGEDSHWYKYRFFHSTGPVASSYTNPFRPPQRTRTKIIQEALETYDAGRVLLIASSSGGSSLVTNDYRVRDGKTMNTGKGSWVRVSSGVGAGGITNVDTVNRELGSFGLAPSLDIVPAIGDYFEWHWLADPAIWYRAVNSALARYWYVDRVPLDGDGAGEQDLTYLSWLNNKSQIASMWYTLAGAASEQPWPWWNARQERGRVVLLMSPPVQATDAAYLEVLRTMDPLFTDESILVPECNIELAAALTYDEVLRHLCRPGPNASGQDRAVWKQARAELVPKIRALYRRYGPRPRIQRPQNSLSVSVPVPWSAR